MEKQDELFIARLEDGIKLSEKRPYFLGFLTESEIATAKEYLKYRNDSNYFFWGGHNDAERKLLGFFPDYMANSAKDEYDASANILEDEFPIIALTITYRKEDKLSHRDFLGSFMALGIERTSVGDILVEERRCVAFIKQDMLDYFIQNIDKIGRVGVKITEGAEQPLPVMHTFKELDGVISSDRLDCVVAFLTRTSREKAGTLIKSAMVAVNHKEILSLSYRVNEKDLISIRTKGRFCIDDMEKRTSKGKLVIKSRKYV